MICIDFLYKDQLHSILMFASVVSATKNTAVKTDVSGEKRALISPTTLEIYFIFCCVCVFIIFICGMLLSH